MKKVRINIGKKRTGVLDFELYFIAEPVFGSTLAAICHHEQTTVPRFIQLVTEVVESKGLDTDGLYRVSGNLSSIQRIRCQVDQGNWYKFKYKLQIILFGNITSFSTISQNHCSVLIHVRIRLQIARKDLFTLLYMNLQEYIRHCFNIAE